MANDPQQFASDNYSGICPEAWAALAEANPASAGYGDDVWTAKASDLPRGVRDRLRSVLRLQRHRGQFALARVALPVLSQRDLFGRWRMSRPTSAARRSSSPTAPSCCCAVRRRQADAGRDPHHRDQPHRHPFSQTPRGQRHPADRDRAGLSPRRTARRSRRSAGSSVSACTWTARASPTPGQPRLLARPTSRGAPASTCSASAAPRTAWRSARPWCSSIRSWRRISTIAANRPGSWPRRCGFSPRRGSACSRAAPGCAMPRTATPVRSVSKLKLDGVPQLDIMFPVQANAVFIRMPDRVASALRDRGWRFYTFIGGGARFMFAWDAAPAARRRTGRRHQANCIGRIDRTSASIAGRDQFSKAP